MNIRTALLATVITVVALPAFAATAPTPAPATPATTTVATTPAPAPVPLQIVVFDKNDFKGNALTIDRPVPDLNALHFDNKVASLQIKGAGDWVLCENKNYTGRCARVQLAAGNLKLFQLNDRVSSLYPVPVPPPAPAPAAAPVPAPGTKTK
jgi:hypothetical protein